MASEVDCYSLPQIHCCHIEIDIENSSDRQITNQQSIHFSWTQLGALGLAL